MKHRENDILGKDRAKVRQKAKEVTLVTSGESDFEAAKETR